MDDVIAKPLQFSVSNYVLGTATNLLTHMFTMKKYKTDYLWQWPIMEDVTLHLLSIPNMSPPHSKYKGENLDALTLL